MKYLKFTIILMTGILFLTLSCAAQVKFGKNRTLRKDIPVFSNPEFKSVQANIYQNGDKMRLTFLLSEKSDVKSIKCKLSFDPMYFFVMGNPVLINEKTKETKEIDYEFKNERVIFDEVIADNHLPKHMKQPNPFHKH
ncbi:hypothetical protein C5S36_04415 [Candidatus Methanophagaceae archaeon]|nr:hypothetical protein C5S36_04415 [Methanophagales archaeon]